jgi:hypothetical protein
MSTFTSREENRCFMVESLGHKVRKSVRLMFEASSCLNKS